MANDCDLQYKSSKNQRLLVELTLMKLASITFNVASPANGQEKKKSDFIIPASFFISTYSNHGASTPKTNNSVPEQPIEPVTQEAVEVTKPQEVVAQEPKESYEPTKIQIKSPEKRVSGLSLSSIKAKKIHEQTKSPDVPQEELPNEAFTEANMQKHWDDFVHILESKGRKILASNLQTDVPKLKNENTIWIELPNSTMKKEVEREQSLMLDYLKQKLNNYSISLNITVNEEVAKKYAFTPQEKYEKLKEKNPTIELLRKEFDLDF